MHVVSIIVLAFLSFLFVNVVSHGGGGHHSHHGQGHGHGHSHDVHDSGLNELNHHSEATQLLKESDAQHAKVVPRPHPSAHLNRIVPPKTVNEKLLRAARENFPIFEVKALFNAGASMSTAVDLTNGFTALHWLANNARDASALPTWLYFLSRNPTIDARDDEGATPLHRAAINNNLAIAELLLEHKADINARDNHGFTALMYTARFARVETGLMLIRAGARVFATSAGDKTPLNIAKDFVADHADMKLLIEALESATMSTSIDNGVDL